MTQTTTTKTTITLWLQKHSPEANTTQDYAAGIQPALPVRRVVFIEVTDKLPQQECLLFITSVGLL